MAGASTQEIAEKLGKSTADIRQHKHNALGSLKGHPEIVARAPRGAVLEQAPAPEPPPRGSEIGGSIGAEEEEVQ